MAHFPFSAIVAQEELKLALQLVVVDPNLGGVLVFGDRGTGDLEISRDFEAGAFGGEFEEEDAGVV